MPAPAPQFIPAAFASGAAGPNRNTIPAAPVTTQRASFQLGFPPLTMLPVVAGGRPMLGPDMNGVLYMLSSHTVYQQSGQPYKYSADVVAAIAGYAIGTLLGSTDGLTLWYNLVAGNTTDPDAGGAGWVAMYSYGMTPVPGLTGGAPRVLTAAEASKNVIVLSGVLTANQQIVLPTQVRRWLIVNSCTGAFTVQVRTAAGVGVIVPAGGLGAPVEVWCDGISIYNVVAPVNLPIDQAPTGLTIAQRTNAGYLFATYFNQSSALENLSMSAIFFENGNDGYHRKISPANMQAQLPLSNFAGQVSNAQVPQSAVTQHAAAVLSNAALTGTPTAPTPAPGTNNSQVATTAFVQAAGGVSGVNSGNGWVRLANGLILQWGLSPNIGNSGAGAVFFPTPFLVQCFNVQITANGTIGSSQSHDSVTNLTTTSFVIQNRATVSSTFYWVAVGV